MVKLNDFSVFKRRSIYNSLNKDLEKIPIGQKLTLQEAQKVLDTSTTTTSVSQTTLVDSGYIVVDGVNVLDNFTKPDNIKFYKDLLNAIDNMILLDYIKSNVLEPTARAADYDLVKSTDINVNLALFYYSVKYPEDKIINETKLNIIKAELKATFNIEL